MKLGILFLVTGLLFTNAFGGADAFSGVKCGSDIPRALTGKRMSNQRVADLEKRHADLGLKYKYRFCQGGGDLLGANRLKMRCYAGALVLLPISGYLKASRSSRC
jgi:hypothetical protein